MNRSDKIDLEVKFDFNERDYLVEGIFLWLIEEERILIFECYLILLLYDV